MFEAIVMFLPMFVSAIMALMAALELIEKFQKAKVALLVFLITCTLLYFAHAAFFARSIDIIPFTDTIYCFCNPAVYPLFFIYVCYLTEPQSNRRHLWLWLIPPVCCGIAVGLCYLMMSQKESLAFIEDYLYFNSDEELSGTALMAAHIHFVVKIIFGLMVIPVVGLGIRNISRYNKAILQNYADVDSRLLTEVKMLTILFFITSLVSMICNILGRYRFANDVAMLAVPSVLFSALIFTLAWLGMRQDFTMDVMVEELAGNQSVKNVPAKKESNVRTVGETDVKADEMTVASVLALRDQIEELMKKEHIFLQHDLRISDLSVRLGSNRNYIYKAINVVMNTTFSEYINRQRVEYAVKMLNEHPEMQINEVSVKSGFASSSAFYRNFKQIIGCSPKEYVEKLNF